MIYSKKLTYNNSKLVKSEIESGIDPVKLLRNKDLLEYLNILIITIKIYNQKKYLQLVQF